MKRKEQEETFRHPRDYQHLYLRCSRCRQLNSATDMSCRYCGANLWNAEVIRGDDYERLDPNEVRRSCFWAIVPGLGLMREGLWGWGLLLFGTAVTFTLLDLPHRVSWVLLVDGRTRIFVDGVWVTCLVLSILSAISVFVTFLAALQRLGLPLPQGKEWGLLVARLVAGYLLFFFVLTTVVETIFELEGFVVLLLVAPGLAIALRLGWILVKPFFGMGE